MNDIVYVDSTLHQLTVGYLGRKKSELGQMKLLLDKQDYRSLEDLGHKFKGVAPSYGFLLLGELGAQLEEQAKGQNGMEVEKVFHKIMVYIENIEIQIKD